MMTTESNHHPHSKLTISVLNRVFDFAAETPREALNTLGLVSKHWNETLLYCPSMWQRFTEQTWPRSTEPHRLVAVPTPAPSSSSSSPSSPSTRHIRVVPRIPRSRFTLQSYKMRLLTQIRSELGAIDFTEIENCGRDCAETCPILLQHLTTAGADHGGNCLHCGVCQRNVEMLRIGKNETADQEDGPSEKDAPFVRLSDDQIDAFESGIKAVRPRYLPPLQAKHSPSSLSSSSNSEKKNDDGHHHAEQKKTDAEIAPIVVFTGALVISKSNPHGDDIVQNMLRMISNHLQGFDEEIFNEKDDIPSNDDTDSSSLSSTTTTRRRFPKIKNVLEPKFPVSESVCAPVPSAILINGPPTNVKGPPRYANQPPPTYHAQLPNRDWMKILDSGYYPRYALPQSRQTRFMTKDTLDVLVEWSPDLSSHHYGGRLLPSTISSTNGAAISAPKYRFVYSFRVIQVNPCPPPDGRIPPSDEHPGDERSKVAGQLQVLNHLSETRSQIAQKNPLCDSAAPASTEGWTMVAFCDSDSSRWFNPGSKFYEKCLRPGASHLHQNASLVKFFDDTDFNDAVSGQFDRFMRKQRSNTRDTSRTNLQQLIFSIIKISCLMFDKKRTQVGEQLFLKYHPQIVAAAQKMPMTILGRKTLPPPPPAAPPTTTTAAAVSKQPPPTSSNNNNNNNNNVQRPPPPPPRAATSTASTNAAAASASSSTSNNNTSSNNNVGNIFGVSLRRSTTRPKDMQ